MRYRVPQGRPGVRLIIIGAAVWIPADLLIIILVPSYGHAFGFVMAIGGAAFAVGAPCMVLGVLRKSRYESLSWTEQGDATEHEYEHE
jgi:hypothetical protein